MNWNLDYNSHDASVCKKWQLRRLVALQPGKMAALLQQVFEGLELSKLPKAAQNKLERALSEQQYEIDALKAQQEQFRVDSGKHLP